MKKREIHGLTNHALYSKWQDMRNRCYNKNVDRYNSYGGRSIDVCDEWRESFKNYYDWCISNGWKKELSIERIDVDKGYNPDNCKFIPLAQQHYNKSKTKKVKYKGTEYCLAELIKKLFPINYNNAYKAIWYLVNKKDLKVITESIENRYRKLYNEYPTQNLQA